MAYVEFRPKIEVKAGIKPVHHWETIRSEPMLYSASPQFALDNGGLITTLIVEDLYSLGVMNNVPSNKHCVIDTRVQMLMPGQYPAIPGWHCDAIQRSQTGQPELSNGFDKDCEHFTCYIGSAKNMAPTEFFPTPVTLNVQPDEVWKSVDMSMTKFNDRAVNFAQGSIYNFNQSTLHRVTPATQRGWRMFFRLSYYPSPALDEIRTQTQVYAPVSQGW